MKRAFLVTLAALTGCSFGPETGCPAIEQLAHRDAVADARTALEKGDRHVWMLGGFVGSVPGVENPSAYPTQMMEGTSDTKTEACARQNVTAETYAEKYNRTIVAGSRR